MRSSKELTKNLVTDDGEGRLERLHRNAYLSNKGIDPKKSHQLDLFDVIAERDDLRHIPNDYARSSLFTVRNKREPRKTLVREKLFHYNEHVTILYTGIELRAEDDELVWLQILNYGRSVPLGEPFEFEVKDVVKDVGWSRSGRNYDRVRECISRLKANEVLALNSKAYGNSGSISLIHNYTSVNDDKGKPTRYRVWIAPSLMVLFAGGTFTSHDWETYRQLSPVARRLVDYIDSHKYPYPLALERFKQMCGSEDTNTFSFRQTARRACLEVEKSGRATLAMVDKKDMICTQR